VVLLDTLKIFVVANAKLLLCKKTFFFFQISQVAHRLHTSGVKKLYSSVVKVFCGLVWEETLSAVYTRFLFQCIQNSPHYWAY
jgi:hypothetical protein